MCRKMILNKYTFPRAGELDRTKLTRATATPVTGKVCWIRDVIAQGWYESDGNTMYFYQCGCSMPQVVNHLSNYVNMLLDRKKTSTLNANAEVFAHEGKEKEMNKNASDVENKEWKSVPPKKCALNRNNKQPDKINKKHECNRFRRLQELIGENEEVQQMIKDAHEQDVQKKETKTIAKRNDPCHVDAMKMDVLEKVIDEFVTKDSSNNNAHQITSKSMENKNANEYECYYEETDDDSEEERKAWRLLHPDEESDSDCSTCYESDEEEDEEEWFNRKIKWRERSNSA